jgi:hypothetical protein
MKIKRILIVGILVAALLVVQAGVVFAQDEPDNPDEITTEETQEPLMPGQNPVAYFMAGVMGVEYDEVSDLQQEGYGFGNISKAYYLCSLLSTLPPQEEETAEPPEGTIEEETIECGPDQLMEYLQSAKEMGWGNVIKQFQADNPDLMVTNGHGVGWMFKLAKGMTTDMHHGKPEWAGGPKDHPNNGKGNNKD